MRPAWATTFDTERLAEVARLGPIDRTWALGGSDGAGIRVAVLDTGVDATHPDVGAVNRSVGVRVIDGVGHIEDDEPTDPHGHGTACASIIRSIAPSVEIWSVRVLGASSGGSYAALRTGLEWAIEERVDVVNLSLSTSNRRVREELWELADRAYFRGVALVGALANDFAPSFPCEYASVFSVASINAGDERRLVANPSGFPEFGAPGIDVDIAWVGGTRIVATGNSFAAPHVAGWLALMRSKHPTLDVGQCKAVLRAIAHNATG